MADKSFGIKQLNLIGASGTPTIESPNNLNLNAVNVAISTDLTVAGKIVAGSGTSISSPSTNVLTFGTNSVERVRINSSGNVGIATTNPPDTFTILGKIHVQQDSGSNNRIILRGQPSSSYRWSIDNYSSSNTFRIFREDDATSASGAVAMSIDASTRNVTISGGNLIFDSGKGIDFSATANSSGTMSSELLSDYEEGTFTPRWGNGSSAYSSPAPTYVSQSGYYTKIGNVVYYDIQIETSAWNGAGSTLWVYGLPFTTNSSGYRQGGGGIFCISGVDSANAISNLTTQIAPNTTRIELYYQTAAVGANYNTFSTNEISETASVSIRISGFYYT